MYKKTSGSIDLRIECESAMLCSCEQDAHYREMYNRKEYGLRHEKLQKSQSSEYLEIRNSNFHAFFFTAFNIVKKFHFQNTLAQHIQEFP